jgi:hypothetical protein
MEYGRGTDMHKRLIGTITLVLCASAAFAAQKGLTRDNTAYCPWAKTPPVIDGRLDDACWRSGPQITGFVLADGTTPAREQTNVYFAYDAKGLYVGIRCFEPEMSKLKMTETAYIWRNDALEIYFDADRDRRFYYHFVVDAAGLKLQSAQEIGAESRDTTWNAPWKAAVSRGEGEWTVEMFFPAATLGFKPRDGAALRANFTRSERGLPEAGSWTFLPNGWHQPFDFGNIVLGVKPRNVAADLILPAEIKPGKVVAQTQVSNTGGSKVTVTPKLTVIPDRRLEPPLTPRMIIPAGGSASLSANLSLPDPREYNLDLLLQIEGKREPIFAGSWRLTVPPAWPDAIGAILAAPDWGTVWEACATFKVMPQMPPPSARERSVSVFAAKNEFEPFQIVLSPKRELRNLRASVSDLRGKGIIPREKVSIKLVETVPVTIPTSPDCLTGDYPDPLPPFAPTDIPAGKNTALWFTVYVPTEASAGDYRGTVTLAADGIDDVSIPVKLHVWNFALPKISRLRTAYGHNAKTLGRWHGVSSVEDKRKTLDLLNQNFIEHRIAPYQPVEYYDWDEDWSSGECKIDFTEWDQGASRYLPRMNSFNLPGAFMGGIGNLSRGMPGYAEMKTKFLRALAAHLREKGWLDKGYNYIFDEPDPPQYAMVVEEAKIWHQADPGLKVLLTEQVEKELVGAVDIWVPVLPSYVEKLCKERQRAGDEVWWYVCCGPLHPYPNNFIDYPAIDPRILHWMNWKYGVTGVLYWSTMFWTVNPWTTGMSYSDDGSGKPLGNGDGRLVYPAVKQRSETPLIAGPVDSIRWEMIREGVEDYDYLYMLNEAVTKAESAGRKDKAVQEGRKALAEAESLIRSRTDFETDPLKLYAVRKRVAEALERLVSSI